MSIWQGFDTALARAIRKLLPSLAYLLLAPEQRAELAATLRTTADKLEATARGQQTQAELAGKNDLLG